MYVGDIKTTIVNNTSLCICLKNWTEELKFLTTTQMNSVQKL